MDIELYRLEKVIQTEKGMLSVSYVAQSTAAVTAWYDISIHTAEDSTVSTCVASSIAEAKQIVDMLYRNEVTPVTFMDVMEDYSIRRLDE